MSASEVIEDDLKTLFGHDEQSQQMVLTTAAHLYLEARRAKEQAEDNLKRKNALLAEAEQELRRVMDDAGIKSLKIDHDGHDVALTASESSYYAAPAGALEDSRFYLWLLRAGGQDLVKRTIHHASFSAFCRELVEAGKALPDEVKVATRQTVRIKEG